MWPRRLPRPETTVATVLIVEDEPALAQAYANWLRPEHEVIVTYSGPSAVEAFSPDVDIVLLDRRMPRMSGDEVLEAIDGRRLECRVAMVTAVDPDFDIVDLPIDHYLVKPVTRGELLEAVDDLLELDYEDTVSHLYAIAAKLAALESTKPSSELERSDAYTKLRDEFRRLKDEADDRLLPPSHGRMFRSLGEP